MAPPRSLTGKVCSRSDCLLTGTFQPLVNFYITKSGYPKGECKECTKTIQRKYYLENDVQIKEKQKQRDENRKEQISLQKKLYYSTHKAQKNEYTKKYNQKRRKEDLDFRIRCNLRTRLNMAVQSERKSGSAVADLGLSIVDFKKWLEQFFYTNPKTGEKMTWENYGRPLGEFGWDIDHSIPLSSFDLTDRKQLLRAVHYSNLRPMWHIQNMEKGYKILNG